MNRELSLYVFQLIVGPIKVGVTDNVKRRLQDIRVAQPYTLLSLAVVPGGYEEESRLHQKLMQWNMSGEWFEDRPEVRAIINEWFGRELPFAETVPPEVYGQVRPVAQGGRILKYVPFRTLKKTAKPRRRNKVKVVQADGSVKVYEYFDGKRVG